MAIFENFFPFCNFMKITKKGLMPLSLFSR
nr:MAG TPA: hypothetical protein [Caudoviricetes sp.]